MDRVLDELDGDLDAGGVRDLGEARGIVAERLVLRRLDKQRGQAAEVSVHRGDERRRRVCGVDVGGYVDAQAIAPEPRIPVGRVVRAPAGEGEVAERGDHVQRSRKRYPSVA